MFSDTTFDDSLYPPTKHVLGNMVAYTTRGSISLGNAWKSHIAIHNV